MRHRGSTLTDLIAGLSHKERMAMMSRQVAQNPAQAAMLAQIIIEQTKIELREAEQGLEIWHQLNEPCL